jgi:hypothetical protein
MSRRRRTRRWPAMSMCARCHGRRGPRGYSTRRATKPVAWRSGPRLANVMLRQECCTFILLLLFRLVQLGVQLLQSVLPLLPLPSVLLRLRTPHRHSPASPRRGLERWRRGASCSCRVLLLRQVRDNALQISYRRLQLRGRSARLGAAVRSLPRRNCRSLCHCRCGLQLLRRVACRRNHSATTTPTVTTNITACVHPSHPLLPCPTTSGPST